MASINVIKSIIHCQIIRTIRITVLNSVEHNRSVQWLRFTLVKWSVATAITAVLHRIERCQHSNAYGSSIAVWERTDYCAHLNLHCPHSNLSCLLHFFVHKVTIAVRTATSAIFFSLCRNRISNLTVRRYLSCKFS